MSERVLVLGAGFAGLELATVLSDELGEQAGVTLIAGCGPGTLFVLTPDLSHVEREIVLSDPDLTNVCFGGDDFRTLFVTQGSAGRLAAIRWPVPGMRLFPERG